MSNPAVDTTCLLNVTCHVATQGVLDNAIGIATLGWIIRGGESTDGGIGLPNVPPNNIGAMMREVRREWWVREDINDPLHGPLSFRDACIHARYLSQDEDHSGLAQVCTYLGSRGGDPIKTPNQLFVAFMFIQGKRTLAGRMAEYHSKNELPPT